jgi:Fic family protein
MSSRFGPNLSISPQIVTDLLRIEAARQKVELLPIHPTVLASLRETSRLFSTHYSTMIEGNRLTQAQVVEVVVRDGHFPGRERDEHEVRGYYVALEELEPLVAKQSELSERTIQTLHALVMGRGRKRVRPTAYREQQNVIRDSATRRIVYMPPEAKDVPQLMKQFVKWLHSPHATELPCALQAGIAHYQLATIHPYMDGNGRTARLITNLILHRGGYGLKGLYSLEEYYAQNLPAYYKAIGVSSSHNYYMGRAEADITDWITYFCRGMAESFERVVERAAEAADRGIPDRHRELRALDAMQRKALELFQFSETIASRDIQSFFGYKPRTATSLLSRWVASGFVVIVSPGKRMRRYALASKYRPLLE